MFERFTEKARRVIFFARYEASQFGTSYIEAEHLLLGLVREDKALANRFLGSHAAIESIRKQIEAHTPPGEKIPTSVDMPLSHESKRVLAYASEESERLGHSYIGTDHLLLGLLRDEKSYAAELLRERGLTAGDVREELAQSAAGDQQDRSLLEFARDLTQAASEGKLNPPSDWDPIVNRLIDILWRRSKNSPVLIGNDLAAAAVVERLAVRIAKHEVPAFFHHWRLVALNISQFASELQRPARARSLMKGLIEGNQIAFFEGPLETICSVFRPVAYMGRLHCICTAAISDYLKWIDIDPLLKPHFEPVELPPTN